MNGTTEKRREKGTGTIYKHNDRYYGKINLGRKADGSNNIKNFSGKSEADVKKQIREFNLNRDDVEQNDVSCMTLEEYISEWLKTYKHPDLKASSYDRLEKTVKTYIIPNLGYIQLSQIGSDDIQEYLNNLSKNDKMLSMSSIKKIYDAMNGCFKHALIKGDISSNPMLLVKIPSKFKELPKKEIRVFSEKEVSLIQEELNRKYSSGTPVYQYGDVFTIMLNTGVRMGEAVGLKWNDYDEDNRQIHVRRNVQIVRKRNRSGDAEQGYRMLEQSTKTYSGNRIIDLNNNANAAIKKFKEKNNKSENIICNSKGEPLSPKQLERTFYRILKNVGIPKTGLHSLRHTFASTMFLHGVDVKTVSKILGHANVSITYNTYIHIIEKQKVDAVKILDNIF